MSSCKATNAKPAVIESGARRRVNLSLNPSTFRKLAQKADEQGIDTATVARIIIQKYLGELPKEQP